MEKSILSVFFLAATLFTGAITVGSPVLVDKANAQETEFDEKKEIKRYYEYDTTTQKLVKNSQEDEKKSRSHFW